MNVIRIKRGQNILTKNITLMAGELALDTVTGVLYTSLVDDGNPVEIKGAASGTVSKAEKADYATKLETKQLIKLTGDVTGEANFDGSAAAEITAVLANITTGATVNGITFNNKGLITGATKIKVVDVDGLETALAGKVDKVEGKSLVDDTEIARLKTVTNYDDTEVKADIEAIETAIAGIDIPEKTSELTNDSGFITSAAIPTAVSAFTNDAGYLTEVPSTYVTESELNAKGYLVASDIANKAEKSELHSHGNKAILDATTASYTEEEAEKLAGLSNYDDTGVKASIKAISDDYLKASDKTELSGLISAEASTARAAEKVNADAIAAVKEDVDAFFADADMTASAKDTLKELQQYIASDETAASEMAASIKANADAIDAIEADYLKGADKTELSNAISGKASASDVTNLTTRVTTAEGKITTLEGAVATKAEKTDVPTKVSQLTNDSGYLTAIPDTYVTETELTAKGYATTSAMNTALADKANSADVYTKTQADAAFMTNAEVEAKGYLTAIPAEYVTETELNAKNYAVKGTTLASYGITNALATDSTIDGGTF